MSQGPPQRPGEEPEGSEHPTEQFGPTGAEQPTQAFGPEPGEQPTQAFDQPSAAGTPPAGSAYGQGGQPGQPGPPGQPSEPGPSQYGQPYQHGDSGRPQRRSPVLAVIGVLVALLVVGGLVFAGINYFAGDDDTADPEQTEPVQDDDLAADTDEDADPQEAEEDGEPENGAAQDDATQDDDTQDGAPDEDGTDTEPQETDDPSEPGGELYDTLTESAAQVEGDVTSWVIDEPGWTVYEGNEIDDIDPREAYGATFTSAGDDSLSMWVVGLDDPQEATDWAESLVEQRGESDHSGPVWDEEQSEDDLVWGEGVFHEWEDGDDLEILWWDDRGVVRYVTGPAEVTRDFYRYLPL